MLEVVISADMHLLYEIILFIYVSFERFVPAQRLFQFKEEIWQFQNTDETSALKVNKRGENGTLGSNSAQQVRKLSSSSSLMRSCSF